VPTRRVALAPPVGSLTRRRWWLHGKCGAVITPTYLIFNAHGDVNKILGASGPIPFRLHVPLCGHHPARRPRQHRRRIFVGSSRSVRWCSRPSTSGAWALARAGSVSSGSTGPSSGLCSSSCSASKSRPSEGTRGPPVPSKAYRDYPGFLAAHRKLGPARKVGCDRTRGLRGRGLRRRLPPAATGHPGFAQTVGTWRCRGRQRRRLIKGHPSPRMQLMSKQPIKETRCLK
jgi:hypothetical protein